MKFLGCEGPQVGSRAGLTKEGKLVIQLSFNSFTQYKKPAKRGVNCFVKAPKLDHELAGRKRVERAMREGRVKFYKEDIEQLMNERF